MSLVDFLSLKGLNMQSMTIKEHERFLRDRARQQKQQGKFRYFCNCVNWPQDDVDSEGGLRDMIDAATSISRKTFMTHVSRDDVAYLAEQLSYASHPSGGLTMAGDLHIAYHRSTLHGKRCYYFCHSAIEYVFTTGE